VRIDVWSDFACPWCVLGLLRLDAALERFEQGLAFEVVHRSFELDPRAPKRRERTMAEAVATKYGMSSERVRSGHQRMTELGREVGFTFDFERVQLGNTFDAHRLARAGRGHPGERALVRGLFDAYFTDGRLLSDHDVLRDVAATAGLDEGLVGAVLDGERYGGDVRADEAEAYELGVTGVPYFLIAGAWPIPGAQDVETLGIVLRRAWSRLGG
jgi:predicted DsbA family dithiol-disulfide isomerase